MKIHTKFFRLSVVSLVVILLSFGAYIRLSAQKNKNQDNITDKKTQIIMQLILQGVQTNHFAPMPLNDQFSEFVFKTYIERMDYNKRFFLQSDIDKLEPHKRNIDDQLRRSELTFFTEVDKILTKRTKEAKTYYQELLKKPFEFTKNEEYESDGEKLDFAKDKTSLKDLWRKSLKYQVLSRVINNEETQDADKKDEDSEKKEKVEKKSFKELEKEAREAVLESHDNWFKRLNQNSLDKRIAHYINVIANVFDPHTGYFAPLEKENFDISMTGQFEGIGATLTQQNGVIKVTEIIPGSASAIQGELKAGDKILKVAQKTGKAVDVVDMPLDDAIKMIRGKKGTTVKLTVKKVDGTIKIIPIIRDVVKLEATYAKSAVIQTKYAKQKYGYIDLPKFYADFSKKHGGRYCAEDVKIEIEKLKKQNIKGLAIDLRNNGGGSLKDVIEMGGLFIKKGPLVQVKSRFGMPYILDDKDSDVVWDGPLVIMINEFSASASEILAAAMQDYERAVIVGSKHSFGKGTVQQFFDLDKFVKSAANDVKPLGSMKLTIQKFYRINGGTTQLEGVKSDIVLPGMYSNIDVGEKEYDYALEWDEIDPATYNKWDKSFIDLVSLKSKSKHRVDKNGVFKLISENSLRLKKQRDETVYSLNYKKYKAYRAKLKKEAGKYDDLMKKAIDEMIVENLPADIEEIGDDESKVDINKKWIEGIQKDVYIEEAMSILHDMH